MVCSRRGRALAATERCAGGRSRAENRDVRLYAGEAPLSVRTGTVTEGYFRALRTSFIAGRGFAPEEDLPGAAKTVVVSHSFWARRLNGDPDVVGEAILLNGEPHTVIGITTGDFDVHDLDIRGTGAPEVWVPLQLGANTIDTVPNLDAFARLKDGVTRRSCSATSRGFSHGVSRALPRRFVGRVGFHDSAFAGGHRAGRSPDALRARWSGSARPADQLCKRRELVARASHDTLSRGCNSFSARREDFVDDGVASDADDDVTQNTSREGFCTTAVQSDFGRAEVREARAIYRLKRNAVDQREACQTPGCDWHATPVFDERCWPAIVTSVYSRHCAPLRVLPVPGVIS
jgi:hypothetical protein